MVLLRRYELTCQCSDCPASNAITRLASSTMSTPHLDFGWAHVGPPLKIMDQSLDDDDNLSDAPPRKPGHKAFKVVFDGCLGAVIRRASGVAAAVSRGPLPALHFTPVAKRCAPPIAGAPSPFHSTRTDS